MTDRERLDDDLAHAPLGPSAAEGWATCPDYINANAGLPDEPSRPAAEGTAAHAISDLCLKHGFDAADFIGQTTTILDWSFTWTAEDAQLLQRGLDRIRALPGEMFTEHRVKIDRWTIPGQFGTLDRAVIVKIDGVWWIFIIDLKWGRVAVYPQNNLQTILYGLGFWNDIGRHIIPEGEEVRFHLEIDQPRCAGGGGVWLTTLDEMLRAGDWLRTRAEATQQPNPPRVASDKGCTWCRRKLRKNGGCTTYDAYVTEVLGVRMDPKLDLEIMLDQPLALPDIHTMTPERRSFILSHKKMVETFLKQLEEAELDDYLAGRPTPGRKAVIDTQKGTRDAWIDEKGAEAVLVPVLGEESFTKKLITPIQAGKKITKEVADKLEPHIKRGENGKSMVPLDDARQAIPVVLTDEFDDLDLDATA